jgi:HEAT repeat protein
MRYLLLLTTGILLTNCGGKDNTAIRESDKFIAQRQYENARAVIDKALRENPKNPKLLRQQIRYFLCTEQTAFAAAAHHKLQETHPGDNTLYRAASDNNPATRITAIRILGEIKTPGSLAVLAKAANDPDKSVRQATLQSLAKLEDKNAIPPLQKLLKDRDWFIRGNAALALGKAGNTGSIPALFNTLRDNDAYVRKSARLSLWRLATEKNMPAYRDQLKTGDPAAQTLAALILTTTGHTEAIPLLITELTNPANPDLAEIIQTLAKTKTPAALPGLRQAITHTNPEIKINAILALGDYQDKSSAGQLKNIQKDPQSNREIKTACTIALNKMGKK